MIEEMLKHYENIGSVKYRQKIKELAIHFDLEGKTGITNFCVCTLFRDNQKYYLSNMPVWSVEFHRLGGARSDVVFDLEAMKGRNFYISSLQEQDDIQMTINNSHEQHGYFDIYSLIRRSFDCSFILLALKTNPVNDPYQFYLQTREVFEDFCIYFISNMLEEIKLKNNEHKALLILNDTTFLSTIIKNNILQDKDKLTERERECIKLLKYGYPPKLIAKSMDISEKTVRNYIEMIREKLNCNSALEILQKAIQYDL